MRIQNEQVGKNPTIHAPDGYALYARRQASPADPIDGQVTPPFVEASAGQGLPAPNGRLRASRLATTAGSGSLDLTSSEMFAEAERRWAENERQLAGDRPRGGFFLRVELDARSRLVTRATVERTFMSVVAKLTSAMPPDAHGASGGSGRRRPRSGPSGAATGPDSLPFQDRWARTDD